ncbi:MAG: hypothetical protein J3Q66DRAFT_108698 [Benniella sp.]|nr:MAG: hypothetical protein J3Q66DRAFT_108698 [Benniella sp.]
MDNNTLAPPPDAACSSHASTLDASAIDNSTAPATSTGSVSPVSSGSPPPAAQTTAAEPTEPLSVPISSLSSTGQMQAQTMRPVAQPWPSLTARKPEWATGDAFFDTMAGMDSTEYRQYHAGLCLDQNLEEAGTSIAPSDNTSATGAEASHSPYSNIGLEHWNRTREQWTMGKWQAVPSPNGSNPALSAIHPGNHSAIYRSLVNDRKRLSKPIPLPLVIQVLVSGWKQDGVWPDSPTQPAPSAPESVPSSEPSLSQGINAYIPGFSSTHSQPIRRNP